jgi:CYTH domain-containing protein
MSPGTEIERKFLVDAPPADLADWAAQRIEQGYVAITADAEVRVRRRGERATLTVKSAPGLRRVEVELPLEPAAFAQLWPLTEGRQLTKVRHVREVGGVTLELDVYADALAGLITLEVEFDDEDAAGAWNPPDWVAGELTGDPAYANQTLATRGVPPR